MDACDTLSEIAADPELSGRLVYRQTLPAREARTAALTAPPRIRRSSSDSRRAASASSGPIRPPRSTPCTTADNVVVATGTASGKSLCYQLPIVDAVVREEPDTALLMFPTKALAQDQLRSLRSWLVPGLKAVTYDGDTSPDDRTWARKHANVVLTNPEMLHQGILPYHRRWATFLMRLRLIVVDELHSLRGHLRQQRRARAAPAAAGVRALRVEPVVLLRRARRSATRPSCAEALCGRPVERDRRRRLTAGERCFGLWQRPLLDEETGRRSSANAETAELLARFVRDGRPTLAFTRSRRGAELVAAQARRRLACGQPRRGGPGRRLPRRATCPRSDASSSASSATAACSASRPPTRSSWASTSAGSTRWCSTGSRARSRRCASRPGARGGPSRRAAAVLVAGRRPARPVVRRTPDRALRAHARGRGREPFEPVRAAAPGRVRGARAAARAE